MTTDLSAYLAALGFAVVTVVLVVVSQLYRHRYEVGVVRPHSMWLTKRRVLPPAMPSTFSWVAGYVVMLLAATVSAIAAIDTFIITYDTGQCRKLVAQVFGRDELKRNYEDWGRSVAVKQSKLASNAKNAPAKTGEPTTKPEVSRQAIDEAAIAERDAEVKDAWLPSDPPERRSALEARLLGAIRLNPGLWGPGWGDIVSLTGAKPRSVFVVAKLLTPKSREQAFETALLFGDAESIQEVLVSESDSSPLTPLQYDRFRRCFLSDNAQYIRDRVRACYTGVFNLGIIAFAVGLFAVYHLRHRTILVMNDEQGPTLADAVEAKVKSVPQPDDMTWVYFWRIANLYEFRERVSRRHVYLDEHGLSPTLAHALAHRLLHELTPPDGQEPEPDVTDAYYARVNVITDDALATQRAAVPSRGESAERVPEFLTELGFLGTIIGVILGMGSAALTQVPSSEPLYRSSAVGDMMNGLTVSFTTTLVGLLGALAMKWWLARWNEQADQSLRRIKAVVGARFRENFSDIFASHRARAPRAVGDLLNAE